MVYNEKYDRWVTKGGLVYRYSKRQDKLILCKPTADRDGYHQIGVQKPKKTCVKVHRLVFETFNGEIPQGYEIDHINTVRDDNRLGNLRAVTPRENSNNPLSKLKMRKPKSEFGVLFENHYHITYGDDIKLYQKELMYYRRHKICSWEVDNECD